MENKQNVTPQPRNIFEQILYGQQAVNDNIIILSENLNTIYAQLNTLMSSLAAIPMSEPMDLGAEEGKDEVVD
jgi:hypothetical protein